MSCSSPEPTREALAQAFSRRLAAAMRERGWKPIPSVLLKHFNRVHWGEPITLYTTRSWLRGQYMPRPHRLVSLALCLGVPPDRLMYGQFYQVPCASESGPSLLLSDRELDVFRLLGHGLGTRQIAAKLRIAASTVETHRAAIKRKLGLAAATELVARAAQFILDENDA